jgi:hypothetical protein
MDNGALADIFMALRSVLSSLIVFSLTYVLLPFERKTKKLAIITAVLLSLFGSALIVTIYHFTVDNPTILGMVFVPVLLCSGIGLLLLFFRQNLAYSVFCFVLSMTVYLIIGFPSEALRNALLAQSFYLANGLYLSLRFVLWALLFVFFLFFLRPRLLKTEKELGHHWLIPLLVSGLVFFLLVFVGVFPIDWSKRDSSNYYLIAYSGVFVVGFYVSLYFFVEMLLKQKRKELEEQAMKKKVEALESKIVQDEHYQDLIARKEHDLHHHISALRGLLEEGKQEEALEYLKRYDQETVVSETPFRTGSSIMDALLAMYAARFKENGITFECAMALGKDFPLNENEIVSFFSNGLENALHGASLCQNGKPFVSLEGKKEKKFYSIRLKNSAKPVSFKNGLPLREDLSNGLGTQNMTDIFAQHGGFSSFTYSEGVFVFEGALPSNCF